MKDKIIYELQVGFSYGDSQGNQQTASFIELAAPTSRNMTECAELKQSFYRALPDDKDATDEDREGKEISEVNGADVIGLILRSKDVKLITVLLHAKALFCSGVAKVDGQTKLTKPLCDKMNNDDFENMVGEYLVNFILASILQKMKNQQSR